MTRDPVHVLILCTGNSARSILGEALLASRGKGRLVAHSAGSRPKGQPHPQALALLRTKGIDTRPFHSKSWDEFATPGAPPIGIVITVCDSAAAETCPIWPGHPVTAHWGLPDPADAPDPEAAFAATWDALATRVEALLALPFEDMAPADLRAALNRIGAP